MKKIKLTQGKFALIDDRDFEELNKFKWYAKRIGYIFYAFRNSEKINGKKKTIAMHAVLAGTSKGNVTDHIDGNGLNNQRDNLRVCSQSQNRMNVNKTKSNNSGYKGVSWHETRKKWRAFIYYGGIQIYLGSFKTKIEAFKIYCVASKKYHKEFSNLA